MSENSAMSIDAQFVLQRDNFTLAVNQALPGTGFIGVFGRSGCGKTSLLRCIAGLEQPTGTLKVNENIWQNEKIFLPTHQRPIAYVFQEASLFPHLSVAGNLDFARKRASQSIVTVAYEDAIALFNIASLLKRKPHELSGGERQRVAMVRALLINPQLLLMDEPLAALDFSHKQEILAYLEQLHRALAIPVLYVSHAIDELARLADYLLVLEQGQVIAADTLQTTLARIDLPLQRDDDRSVVIEAAIAARDQQWHLARAAFSGGDIWVKDIGEQIGTPVRIRILARDVSLALDQDHASSILNRVMATVTDVVADEDAAMCLVKLQAGTNTILARVTRRSLHGLNIAVGDSVCAQIKSVAIVR